MPQNGFRGAWLANASREPNSAVLHTADPAHAGGEEVDPALFAYQAPPMQEVPAGPAYIGTEWVVRTPGTSIDHTDYQSHDATRADEGASRQRNYTVPSPDFAGDKYVSNRFPGVEAYPPNPVALQRGLNALPENNPEGFPLGTVEQYYMDRKLYVGERFHDTRVVTPNTAYEPTNVPPPAVGNQYTSPFGSLARAIHNVNATPGIRRPPVPMNDDMLTDSTDDLYPGAMVANWVQR